MIELKGIHKVYQKKNTEVQALKGVDLSIDKGDIFGVIGYSGAGKSTLVRLVNYLERPSQGQVIVDGAYLGNQSPHALRQIKKQIGMIFQHFNLLESKTIFKNVAMPLILAKKSKQEIRSRVLELLQFVGLEDKASNYPSELSGGQKQRVGIARALASNPKILLCDEATSALDPQTTQSILSLLQRVNKKYGITIMIITHEMSVIQKICNKVAVMEEGRVIEEGSVLDVFGHPEHETSHKFVQTVMNTDIPSRIKEQLRQQGTHSLTKLEMVGEHATQPILSTLIQRFDLKVSAVFTNMIDIQNTTLAIWYLDIQGDTRNKERALSYLKQNDVLVKEVTV
ncbi:D-methionine transport system ATP-binding protein [Pelagirhabdus alkalitolerans]|uniref:D-methionine transport system ATP-binding protein n=1 Tax=Pelagirhabdus alkalitolerans TaxID=1612202 RepID=A0A1G6J1X0_9BACI|nr:ATP-binding cassette domain-containing protein [Pelagirhabdus alkalitolerans]SDC11986.1 D-methionine transport system ATP-binding protein [Pelagirhabdus alkalitolerans]